VLSLLYSSNIETSVITYSYW